MRTTPMDARSAGWLDLLRAPLGPRTFEEQALRELLTIRDTPDGVTLLRYCVFQQLNTLAKRGELGTRCAAALQRTNCAKPEPQSRSAEQQPGEPANEKHQQHAEKS